MEAKVIQRMALPLHIQRIESVLNLNPYLSEIEKDLNQPTHFVTINDDDVQDESYSTIAKKTAVPFHNRFNFSDLTSERQWIKNLLLSETDDSDDDLRDSEKVKLMLEIQYKRQHHWRKRLKKTNKMNGYQYYSAGLLLPVDKYPEIKKSVTSTAPTSTSTRSKMNLRPKQKKHAVTDGGQKTATPTPDPVASRTSLSDEEPVVLREVHAKEREQYRKKLWSFIVKKEIPRMAKQFSQSRHVTQTNNKKVAQHCQKEVRKLSLKSQKLSKESNSIQPRARRIMKEVLVFWRKYEKVEKEARKKAEKEAQEQQKLYEEMREARRQQRKLNFLITQTELYAHFMSKKITDDTSTDQILSSLDNKPMEGVVPLAVKNRIEETDDYDSAYMKETVLNNVKSAVEKQKAKHKTFVDSSLVNGVTTDLQQSFDDKFSLANPVLSAEDEVSQASIFNGQLKAYQIKGMSWLASLYDQGINGILADEMGLGKTVQSIALLAHLAEHQNIWGPFLIVSPASTLHNWQQECTRFVPVFKVLPYWGSPHERKVIRKYWNQKLLCSRNSPFHVLITSYQLVVQDFKYFQRIKWQYMILDEAQAIKSSSSVRWKMLMSFNCRNRLLLTGTPIQNTMAELWALLHFIMPTMFDSHDEFSEWFSKDIESHAEKKSALDENQLTRLHMILKPFMLRRIKKDVEHEMAEKIEVHLSCGLSTRQKELYRRLRGRISIDDLLHSSFSNHPSKDSTSTLMNLVMQFRKVCNHPDLFECRDVLSPLTNLSISPYTVPCIVYNEVIHPSVSLLVNRSISSTLNVVSSDHAHKSSLDSGNHLWSFIRHTIMSPSEAVSIHSGSLVTRMQVITRLAQSLQLLYLKRLWSRNASHLFSISQDFCLSPQAIHSSSLLRSFVFTSHTSRFYSHLNQIVYPISYKVGHELDIIHSTAVDKRETSTDDRAMITDAVPERKYQSCVPTDSPKILNTFMPKVLSKPITVYASNRGAEYARATLESGGPPEFRSVMLNGCTSDYRPVNVGLYPEEDKGLRASRPLKGWSDIHIPTKENMVIDSGKMAVLDKLLCHLKQEGHRVLLYSQMTRMIDILEDFMAYRRHKYIRLDGSSRICDRRDMVEDFQTRSDIFVFILSTRAGGLGINLTAADTVIFYDSDWNPTVDQQAMDRAHRLGQTKQVTVYRLIVKGSIEERILQRANEKSEIQKMVISGGDFKSDTLKPKEVVSLLLDDEEMETRFLAKQAEKKVQEEQTRLKTSKTRKRKLVQKTTPEAAGTPPAAKRSNNSLSASPASHGLDNSVPFNGSSSNGGGDHINGIDVVGYTTPTNNHFDKPKSKLGKRPPSTKRTKKSQVENKRSKGGPLPQPNSNSYPSPSNSFPNSPLSVSSSALNIDVNHAPSPRASPLSFSGGPSHSLSVTPPRKYTKKAPSRKQNNKSNHH